MFEAETEMEGTMRQVAQRVRSRLEADLSLDARAVAREELRRVLGRRVQIVGRMAGEVADSARTMHVEEVRGAPVMTPDLIATLESTPVSREVAEGIVRGRFSVDGETLAQQLSRVDEDVARRMAVELREARQAAESAIETAKRLTRVAGRELQTEAPRYIQQLADLVEEAPTKSAVRSVIRRFRKRMLRTGLGGSDAVAGTPFSVRGATRRLLAQLQKAQKGDTAAAVREWVEGRAVRRARSIARTEASRSFDRAYEMTAARNPNVYAHEYNLSTSHPTPDICDVMANADPHGYGPGCYEQDAFPGIPQHTNCLCFRTAKLLRPDGTRPEPHEPVHADEWMDRQSRQTQEDILGKTRARIARRDGASAVMSRTGRITRVRDLPPER